MLSFPGKNRISPIRSISLSQMLLKTLPCKSNSEERMTFFDLFPENALDGPLMCRAALMGRWIFCI